MSSKAKIFACYWLPLVAYCGFIFLQSSYPSPDALPSFKFSDKLMHFGAFVVMGVLFYRAYQTLESAFVLRWIVPLSMISASLYGISDEIHQYFVPYRYSSLGDVVADILGAVCGVYIYHRWIEPMKIGKQRTDS